MKDIRELTVQDAIDIEKARIQCMKSYEWPMSDAAVMEGISLDKLKSMEIGEAGKIVAKWSWIYEVLSEETLDDKIEIKGKVYKVNKVDELKFGQFMDLDSILKRNKDTPYQAIPAMVAILINDADNDIQYRKQFNKISSDVLKMRFLEVIKVVNFTLRENWTLLTDSPLYTEIRKVNLKKELIRRLMTLEVVLTVKKRDLKGITGGIQQCVIWLTIRLIRLIQSSITL